MTVFEKLQAVTEAAGNEQDLPDFLRDRIFEIILNRETYRGVEKQIEDLAEMVTNYDTYGQTGYMGMGVNNVILEKALQRLEAAQNQTARNA